MASQTLHRRIGSSVWPTKLQSPPLDAAVHGRLTLVVITVEDKHIINQSLNQDF
jgi:hypothetical protein